eukprot:7262926-Alexandrium_andersonii.AAC.1
MQARRTRRYIIQEAALRPPDEQVQLGRGALCERSTDLAICIRPSRKMVCTWPIRALHLAPPVRAGGASR